jgi:hypothetical protein
MEISTLRKCEDMTSREFYDYMYSRVSYNVNRLGWDRDLIPGIIAQAAGESGYNTGWLSSYFNWWGMTDGWGGADYYVYNSHGGWCAFNSKYNGIDFYFNKLQSSRIYVDAKNQTNPYSYVRYLSSKGWNEEGVESYMKLMTPIIDTMVGYYGGTVDPDPEDPDPDPEPVTPETPRITILLIKGALKRRRLRV